MFYFVIIKSIPFHLENYIRLKLDKLKGYYTFFDLTNHYEDTEKKN